MSDKLLYWHNGLFLKPHHLQYLQQQIQGSQKETTHAKYNWGIDDLHIDTTQLEHFQLTIKKGRFYFQDGSNVNYPDNAVVATRNIYELIKHKTQIKCYIGLKKMSPNGHNVTILDHQTEELSTINTRFTVNKRQAIPTSNLYEANDVTDVLYLNYFIKIFFEEELNNHTDYDLIPMAILHNKEGRITLDETYTPPLTNLFEHTTTQQLFEEIYNHLLSYTNKLESYKPPYDENSVNTALSKQLIILQSIAHYIPLLESYFNQQWVHPHDAYMTLYQLCSTLSTFTNTITVKGKNQYDQTLIKPYHHTDLTESFSSVKMLFDQLLKEISIGPNTIIPLQFKDDFYTCEIPKSFIQGNSYRFFIEIDTHNEQDHPYDVEFIKISNTKRILDIVTRSLSGLKFTKQIKPPAYMPSKKGVHYIELHTQEEEWVNIKHLENIAVFLDEQTNNIDLKLMIFEA